MYQYHIKVLRVVDGDTLHVDVDLGMDIHVQQTLRLYGLNAPERNTSAGIAASVWLRVRLALAADLIVDTVKDRREKYGRYLGTLWDGALNINEEMIAAGQAVVYLP